MIKSKNLNEFVDNGNLEDITKILYKKYNNLVLKYGVDDLVNNFVVFTDKYKTFEKYDEARETAFSTWVYSALHYSVLTMNQKESRHDVSGVELDHKGGDGSYDNYMHEIVGRDDSENADNAELNIDKDLIFSYLKTCDKPSHTITFSTAFKAYCLGYTDKDLAKQYNITIAGVGALKRKMRILIKKKFHQDELN